MGGGQEVRIPRRCWVGDRYCGKGGGRGRGHSMEVWLEVWLEL
jgi:hypothetical protein